MARANESIEYDRYQSDFGAYFVARSARGICAVEFADCTPAEYARTLASRYPGASVTQRVGLLDAPAEIVFAADAESVPLDVGGTDFQQRVWREVQRVPRGETITYQGLARRIGQPRSARAVARAVARNRIAYLIPCHRVVRTDGSPGGYRWGPERKSALLDWECAAAQ